MLGTGIKTDSEINWGRAAFMLLFSMVLCSFVPSAIFAPIPLTLIFLSYGNRVGGMGAGVAFILFLILASIGGLTGTVALLYAGVVVFAYLTSEIIKRGIAPDKGVYIIGLSSLSLLLILWAGLTIGGGVTIEQQVDKIVQTSIAVLKQEQGSVIKDSTSQEGLFLKEMIEKPELLTKQILSWLPAMVVVTIFLTAWITLMLILRNSSYWRSRVTYSYEINDLINFKVPEYFVYPLIISLALALGSDVIGFGNTGEVIAFNILYGLGVFYFFQGFGVYMEFLNFMKIYGIMRTVLVVMTILMANRMLVFIGIFDLWVNFRKFLKKKDNNEGDIS